MENGYIFGYIYTIWLYIGVTNFTGADLRILKIKSVCVEGGGGGALM